MSALEQIRKRPVLIISILGLALVLFILTAVSHPEDLFRDPTTIAKVDGTKIDYNDFVKRADELRDAQQRQYGQTPDNSLVQEQAMQSLISEALMKNEIASLGITVTDDELGRALLGENALQMATQIVYQNFAPLFGQYVPADMIQDMIKNPAANSISPEQAAQLKAVWEATLDQVREALSQQKFAQLVMGTLQANKLDAQSTYDDAAMTSSVRYAKVDLSSVRDEDVEVSDADINAQYNADKNLYKIEEPTYLVNYITAQVLPSDEDRQAATTAVENALMGLREEPGTQAVDGNLHFVVTRHNAPLAQLPGYIIGKMDELKADTVAQISFYDNKWTLAKYLGSSMANDSVTVDMIYVLDEAKADSVLQALVAGAAVESFGDDVQAQLDQKLSLLDPKLSQIASALDNATVGEYFTGTVEQGMNPQMITRVKSKKAPVQLYNVAEIVYHLEPSNTTITDYQSKLRAYVNENNNATAFVDNATAAGYTAIPATVTASSLSINGIPETRNLAKWAVNAKKGEVSDVVSDADRTMFIAAVLSDTYKDYIPVTDSQVKAQMRTKALRAKKAEKLLAQYEGKSTVDAFADAAAVRVDTIDVNFSRDYAPGLMPGDTKAIAIMSNTEKGQVNGPVATDYAVVVYEVLDTEAQPRAYDFETDAAYFQQSLGAQALLRNFEAIMRANSKIENKIQKFVAN